MKILIKNIINAFSKGIAFLLHKNLVKSISFLITSLNTQYIVKQLKSNIYESKIYIDSRFLCGTVELV